MIISEKGMYRARYHGKKAAQSFGSFGSKKVEDSPCYAKTNSQIIGSKTQQIKVKII